MVRKENWVKRNDLAETAIRNYITNRSVNNSASYFYSHIKIVFTRSERYSAELKLNVYRQQSEQGDC